MIDLSPLLGAATAKDAEMVSFRVFPKRGAERWMLETNQHLPWHLKTWPRVNLRAKIIFRTAWAMGTVGLHLPSRIEKFAVAPTSVYAQLRSDYGRLGIFLGTPGPNRKFVVYAERPGSSIYLKIPQGANSASLIANETAALIELSKDPNFAQLVPRIKQVAGNLAVQNIETDGVRHKGLNLQEVSRIHDLLEHRSRVTKPLSELRHEWAGSPGGAIAPHEEKTKELIANVRKAANDFLNILPPEYPVTCYLAHGDFTTWNVLRAADGTARIIDWELYGIKPRYFDLIHYFVSHDLLVTRKSSRKILARLCEIGRSRGGSIKEWHVYMGLYFSVQALYYCKVFDGNPGLKMHKQAYWQMNAWVEILQLLNNKKI